MNKREILFHGKRIDNGEWVEGYYTYTASGSRGFLPSIIVFNGGSTIPYFVDPSTLGEYTGLTDKNGKKIFEGDIVYCICKEENFKAVVEFGNPNGFYSWGWQLNSIQSTHFNEDILLWVETELDDTSCEIIGNIYDKD